MVEAAGVELRSQPRSSDAAPRSVRSGAVSWPTARSAVATDEARVHGRLSGARETIRGEI